MTESEPDDLPALPTEAELSPEAAELEPEPPAQGPAAQRRVVLRRSWLPFEINWPAMLVILVLVAVTVFLLLLNQEALPAQVVIWWPLAIAVPSALWFLIALFRRDARGVLASAALFGVSISVLLSFLRVAPLAATLVGIFFIATGTAIMLRGLLLRHQPIG